MRGRTAHKSSVASSFPDWQPAANVAGPGRNNTASEEEGGQFDGR